MKTLIITSQFDSHADWMIEYHFKPGEFIRWNNDDYPTRNSVIVTSDCAVFWVNGESFLLDDISSIWYRKPQAYDTGEIEGEQAKQFAQDECKAFIEGALFLVPEERWVNNLHSIRQSGYKIPQLRLAKALGFTVPPTLVTTNPDDFRRFRDVHGKVIYKPMGRNETRNENGICFAYTTLLDDTFETQLESIRFAPNLFQSYVEKQLELRITVVGDEVFACAIDSQAAPGRTRIDWRHYDLENTPHTVWRLPENIESLCRELVERLGLKYGAIDMILTPEGEYVFIEINPNGQWLWIEQLTGLPIADAIYKLLRKPC